MKSNFSTAYKVEMRRIFKGKSVFLMMAVTFVVVMLVFASLASIKNGAGSSSAMTLTVPEDIDDAINNTETALQIIETQRAEGYPVSQSRIYSLKAELAAYEYFKANNITDLSYKNFGYDIFNLAAMNMYDYVNYGIVVSSSVVLLYVVILAAASIAGERKNGTIKITLLRPVSLTTVILSKFLSLLTVAAIFIFGTFIVSCVFGLIACGGFAVPVLIVFNASCALLVNPFIAALLLLVFAMLLTAVLIFGGLFFSVLFRGKLAAVALSLVCLSGFGLSTVLSLISMLFGDFSLATVLPGNVCDWTAYFSQAMTPGFSSFYIALALTALYATGFIFGSIKLFNRQDN